MQAHQPPPIAAAEPRPPVVTVLGHIDHGKTTLLDRLRQTQVAKHEAGHITQSISGSHVATWQGRVTFLDTPGHEAFEAMRQRGAAFTDLVLLVVASTEGVMPMTRRVAELSARLALPLVVALTKIDAPGADPARVRQQLLGLGLVPEELGGEVLVREVSAVSGEGVDELVEAVALQAMLLDARAHPQTPAQGYVLDVLRDPLRGPRARVIVRDGTLRVGDRCQAGPVLGWVRAMIDDRGRSLDVAPPSVPVDVFGLPELPPAGAPFSAIVGPTHRRAHAAGADEPERPRTAEQWLRWREGLSHGKLKAILRAPSQGAVEGLQRALEALDGEVQISVLRASVGQLSEDDVKLASASGAILLGMGVRVLPRASALAARQNVLVYTDATIYGLIEAARALAASKLARPELPPVFATVTHVFKRNDRDVILGVRVTEGTAQPGQRMRVTRAGAYVAHGKVVELRRFREVVPSIEAPTECGLRFEPAIDVEVGDQMEIQRL